MNLSLECYYAVLKMNKMPVFVVDQVSIACLYTSWQCSKKDLSSYKHNTITKILLLTLGHKEMPLYIYIYILEPLCAQEKTQMFSQLKSGVNTLI